MSEENHSAASELPAAEKEFLAGAEQRIARGMWVFGIVGMLVCWLWRDWSWGAGFAVGGVISALNFHWMKTAVGTLTEVAISQPSSGGRSSRRPGAVVARFGLRYALIGLAAYVIFKSSIVSLAAFFLGLFLFLAAILAEISYQIYCGFRKA